MINLYIEGVRCDLEGKETIATSYSIAPFSDIGKRTTNASINFKLPLTANNRAIFENNNVVVNASTLPYRYLSARLDVDGIDQKIRSAQLISIKDSIEIKLLGGNIDFFAAIKELKLSDLDLSSLIHVWSLANVVASAGNTSNYVYSLADTFTDSPNTYIDNVTNQIDIRGLPPSMFLHSVISQIVTDAGFTASGDFLTNADYQSIVLQGINKNIGKVKDRMLASAEIAASYIPAVGVPEQIPFDTPIFDPLGLYQFVIGKGDIYKVYLTGTYSIRITINFTIYDTGIPASNFVRVSLGKYVSPAYAASELGFETFSGVGIFTEIFEVTDVDLAIDDYVFGVTLGNSYEIHSATIEIIDTGVSETQFGKEIDPVGVIGELKQSDILKALAQQFGLMYAVDNDNMIVYFRQFSEIVANKPNAKDWSDKVDYSEKTEVNFSDTSYGQTNHCQYAEDETVIKPSGTDYDILIGNKTLKPEYKLFELPYAASEQVLRMLDHSIAQIKIFTNYDTTDEEVNEVTPRVLIRRMQSFSPALDYTDGTTTTAVISVPLTHFILFGQSFNLGFEDNLLPTYSQDIIDVIQNFKLINLLLRINVVDINQLDFFIPVWVERKNEAGAYFYLSEIKQFKSTSKESSETELVLLP